MHGKLRNKRESSGLTQEDMAVVLGYKSKNAYSLKERGKRKFYVDEAYKIAQKFNTSIEALFFDNTGNSSAINIRT